MANRQTAIMGGGIAAVAAAAISGYFAGGLTAAGTTQGTAVSLVADKNVFTTVALNAGAIITFAWNTGDDVKVYNQGANPLLVYPPVGSQINALGVNVAFPVPVGKPCEFTPTAVGQYAAFLSA